jgi:uncharacterized membrane protein YfcA
LFPLKLVVPFMLVMDFSASLALTKTTHRHVSWPEIKPLIPGAVIGIVVGTTLLLNLAREPLLTTLGLFVILFAVRSILNLHGEKTISRWWALPAGLLGGTISALFGTGGPPYVIYLSHRIRDKNVFRATNTRLFLMEGGLRLIVFASAGLLSQKGLLTAYLGGLPILAIGLWIGSKVHVGISNLQMARLIGTLLLLSGTSLLWKAWA